MFRHSFSLLERNTQMRISQYEFYKQIAQRCGIYIKDACVLTHAVFEEIAKILENGDCFTMEGFGRFETYQTKTRTGTNPNTLEKMVVKSAKNPHFIPSHKLKERIRENG